MPRPQRPLDLNEKLDSFPNNCVLVALRLVSGQTDQQVMSACYAHGWSPGCGMYMEDWLAAARDMGLELGPVMRDRADPASFHASSHFAEHTAYRRRYNSKPTLAQWADRHDTGTWLVRVERHLLVVRDGVVVDPNRYGRTSRCRVWDAIQVLNAPPPPAPGRFLKPLRGPHRARPRGARRVAPSFVRYREMYRLLNPLPGSMRKLTPAQVFAQTHYTAADLAYDLRLGHVALVD